MSVVKKAIEMAIRKKEKQFKEIDDLLSQNVISEIIALREKAQQILKENGNNYEKIAALIKPLGIEERKLKEIGKKQSNMNLFDKKIDLSIEISELKSELARLDFYGIKK